MTTRPDRDSRPPRPDPARPDPSVRATRAIARAVTRACLALALERLWRAAIWPLGIVALFVALAWLGLFEAVGETVRLALIGLFALAALLSLAAFLRFRPATQAEALARIEAETGLRGRPLLSLTDRTGSDDAAAQALWRAHLARLDAHLPPLVAGPPRPDLGRRDRFLLRPALAILVFLGLFAAEGRHLDRLDIALKGPRPVPPEVARIDAWVTPPAYTGLPALVLTGDRAAAPDAEGRYLVLTGSTLALRAARSSAGPLPETAAVATAGGTSQLPPKPGATALARDFEMKLTDPVTVALDPGSGTPVRWTFAVKPDAPPQISPVNLPEIQRSGAFRLTYDVSDDYAVVGATARVLPDDAALGAIRSGRSLVPAPDFALMLPQARGHNGQAQTLRDLTAHPWAGAPVKMVLEAVDEAGQTGSSEIFRFRLPQKPMTKPLARALVEQRRLLALDADRAGPVADALDALLIAPEHFTNHAGHYFGLRMIDRALKGARSDDDLRGVMDLMWMVARQIEDGDQSEAERALREAQDALRQAIEKNAPPEEIARLTDELRKAMDRFLRDMAERAQRNPETARRMDQQGQLLRPQDIEKMLKRIEDLAKTGSKEAAQQLLNELQRMMENLQTGRNQPPPAPGDGKMQQMLDKLGQLLQRQQDLIDKTHKADPKSQRGQRPSQRGQPPAQPLTPEELAKLLEQLEKQQGENREALKDLMDQLAEEGLGEEDGPGEEPGAKGRLGEAGEAMGEAGKALGRGKAGEALGPEGEAMEALRQGAQGLMRELSQRPGQGQGQGQGQGRNGPGGNDPGGRDPLGRERGTDGPDLSNTVKIPGEIDAERARKILEDIRSRLSQQARPQQELDYLDRLLKAE